MDAGTIAKLGVLGLVPLLIAFGEFLKGQGVQPKLSALVVMATGFVIAAGYTLAKAYPAITPDATLNALLLGMLVGLSSCGFYSVTSTFGVNWGGTRAYYALQAQKAAVQARRDRVASSQYTEAEKRRVLKE